MVTGIKHLAAFIFIAWCHDDKIWNTAHETDIKCTLVSLTIGTDNACTVNGEENRQILNGDIMNELVISALQES